MGTILTSNVRILCSSWL